MQKKVIALAVATALTSPLTAQAGASVYGKIHVSIENISNDNPAATTDGGLATSSNSSRVGVKGDAELDNGMKVIFQAESEVGFGNDTTSKFMSRNTFVGLSGGFGTLLTGRHDTPFKGVGRSVDYFGDGVGDSRSVINPGKMYDLRPQNVIAYAIPETNGFSATLALVTDAVNDKKDNADNSATSASVFYKTGGLMLGAGFQSISADVYGANSVDETATRVVAKYDFGMFELAALAQNVAGHGGVDGMDTSMMGLGGKFKLGNGSDIRAQFYQQAEWESAAGTVANTDVSKMAIGYFTKMAKKTTLYLTYASVSNGDAANTNITSFSGHGDAGPTGTKLGGSPNAVSVGLVHKF